MTGKARCRMHGGAKGSGAPKGNSNAFKHGRYTRENVEHIKELRDFLRESREFLREIE